MAEGQAGHRPWRPVATGLARRFSCRLRFGRERTKLAPLVFDADRPRERADFHFARLAPVVRVFAVQLSDRRCIGGAH